MRRILLLRPKRKSSAGFHPTRHLHRRPQHKPQPLQRPPWSQTANSEAWHPVRALPLQVRSWLSVWGCCIERDEADAEEHISADFCRSLSAVAIIQNTKVHREDKEIGINGDLSFV
mmetsp:Transcript_126144/g.235799  ORF Transcript_126144/g.235799 Transcript_126144/m.235799 type:complete len:116 (-) Transcript_126144:74-421(-)